MQSSSRFRLLGLVAAAASLAVASFGPVTSHLKVAADWAWCRAVAFICYVFSAFASPEPKSQPTVTGHQACAYALKLTKRERPRMTPGWRMCPSG